MTENTFDLLRELAVIRRSTSNKAVYELWDTHCTSYDRGRIGLYEWEEIRDVVFSKFAELENTKNESIPPRYPMI